MVPSFCAELATTIVKFDVQNPKTPFFYSILRLEMQLKSYASPHFMINVHKIIKFFSIIIIPSFKVNVVETPSQNLVFEGILDISIEDKNTYGQITSRLITDNICGKASVMLNNYK